VNYKAGIRHADLQHIRDVTRPEGEPLPNPCNDAPNRYSIWAELCYGTRSVEIVRKYLDGGALRKLVRAKFAIGIFWTTGAAYDFNLLLACAMSLGTLTNDVLRTTTTDTMANIFWKGVHCQKR